MNALDIQKINSFLIQLNKENSKEYYLKKGMFNDLVLAEHDKGHRPINNIERDYFEELDLDVSMSFFKWYLKNYCIPCNYYCDYNINPVEFYDIVACSEQLKNDNRERLKKEYKDDNMFEKTKKSSSNEYYYAKVDYIVSPTRWKKEHHTEYAIVYNGWAYTKPNGTGCRHQIKENPGKYDNKIIKIYYRCPKEMSKENAEAIINKISRQNKNLKLAKPNS